MSQRRAVSFHHLPRPAHDTFDVPRDEAISFRECEANETENRIKIQATWQSSLGAFVLSSLWPLSQQMITTLAKQIIRAQRESEEATVALAERDAELSGLLLHTQSQGSSREELSRRYDAVEKKYGEATEKVVALETHLKDTQDALQVARSDNLDLQATNQSLEAGMTRRAEELSAATKKTDELRGEVRDLKSRTLELENDLYSAQSLLRESRGRLTHAESIAKDLRDRNVALLDEMELIARDIPGTDSGGATQGALTSRRHEDSPKGTLSAVATVRDRLDAIIESKNAEISQLSAARALDAEKIARLESTVASTQQQVLDTTARFAAAQSNLEHRDDSVKEYQAIVNAKQNELSKMADQLSAAQQQLRDAHRVAHELTESNRNLQREASMWENRVRESEIEARNRESRCAQLVQDSEARVRLVAHLESLNETITGELEGCKTKLALTSAALEESNALLNPVREELERNEKLISAIRRKFDLESEKHNATFSMTPTTTPRTGHYRAPEQTGDDSFLASTDGTIVERLQDVVFAKNEEIKRLSKMKISLQAQLTDAEATIERLTHDGHLKNEEFRKSLSQALSALAGIGGYDSLVDGVFRAKEVHFKAMSLESQLAFEQQKSQKLLVRCRVLERHLEEAGRNQSDALQVGEVDSDFSARLANAIDTTPKGDKPASARSPVLSLDGSPRADAFIRPTAVRGLLVRPESSALSGTTRTTYQNPAVKSPRVAELQAKLMRLDSLRSQLLDVERAATTSNGTTRHRLFEEIERLHGTSGLTESDSSRRSTPKRADSHVGNSATSSRITTPRSNRPATQRR